jgi:hypothetical protein
MSSGLVEELCMQEQEQREGPDRRELRRFGSRRLRRHLLTAGLLWVLAGAVCLAYFYGSVIPAAWKPPLSIVECPSNQTGLHRRFSLPETKEVCLYRLGPSPTPCSISQSVENASSVCVFLFENLGDLTLVSLDKRSMTFREASLGGSKLSYRSLWDNKEADKLWIATCEAAGIFTYDSRTGAVNQICRLPEESHIFGLDQLEDGDLIAGTYPKARCLRIQANGTIKEVAVDSSLTAGCPYLHDVFAAGSTLILHYGSPGVLLRHDLVTGKSEVLLRSKRPFLDYLSTPEGLTVSDEEVCWHFNRRGKRVNKLDREQPGYRLTCNKESCRIECTGRSAVFSLAPRHGGMNITAFAAASNGKVYGGTYWNTWMFTATGGSTPELHGLGPLPGGSGEFFSIGWLGRRVAIPNYQGHLFLFDPARPFGTNNPVRAAQIEQAHYGLACAAGRNGELVYATQPNYHQPGGMLVSYQKDGSYSVSKCIGDNLTLGSLAYLDDMLCGGTVETHGLGLGSDKIGPPKIPQVIAVAKDMQTVTAAVNLGSRSGDVLGLVPLDAFHLLAATDRDLFQVEQAKGCLRAKTVSRFSRYRWLFRCPIQGLAPYQSSVVLVNAPPFLFAYDVKAQDITLLCRLPVKIKYLAVEGSGDLFLAESNQIYFLPRAALMRLFQDAGLEWLPD